MNSMNNRIHKQWISKDKYFSKIFSDLGRSLIFNHAISKILIIIDFTPLNVDDVLDKW